MKSFFKKHIIACMCALAIGVLTGAPQLIAIHRAGEAWHGIYPAPNDDEMYYLARVHEVYDGYTNIAQPYLAEGKDSFPLQFWVPDAFVAFVGETLNLSIQQVFILFDFVAPALIFLLLYAIALRILSTRTEALSFGIAMSAGLFFYTFGRPISPQITIVPLLFFVYALYRYLTHQERGWAVLSALSFGLLFHTYTYYWTFAVVFLGLLGLYFLIRQEYVYFKKTFLTGLSGLIIGIPYFIQLKNIFSLQTYTETVARVGMIETHFPSGILIVGIAGVYTLGVAFCVYKKYVALTVESVYVSLLIIATAVVVNQHIITGQNLEFSSHYRTLGILFGSLGAFFLWNQYFRHTQQPSLQKRTAAFVLGVVCMLSTFQVLDVVRAQISLPTETQTLQRYGDVIRWIDTRQGVYYTHQTLSALIPAYTSSDVLYAREANMHFMSDTDVRARYVRTKYFEEALTVEEIIEEERYVFGTHYINTYQHALQQNKLRRALGFSEVIPDRYPMEAMQDLVQQWESVKKQSFKDVMKEYKVTYLVWDTLVNPDWNPETKAGNLTKVYEKEGVIVYTLE